jgi:hypothetical protein
VGARLVFLQFRQVTFACGPTGGWAAMNDFQAWAEAQGLFVSGTSSKRASPHKHAI